jgi:hypothetical protein
LEQQVTKVLEFLKDFKTNENITFSKFLNLLHLDEETYILTLRSKLMKPNIFFKHTPSNIKTNAFSIHANPLWFAATYIQFIFNSYATASYCTLYITTIENFVTLKLHSIIDKCI